MTAAWSEARLSGGMSLLASAPSFAHRRKWIRPHSEAPPALIIGGKEVQSTHSQENKAPAPTVEEGQREAPWLGQLGSCAALCPRSAALSSQRPLVFNSSSTKTRSQPSSACPPLLPYRPQHSGTLSPLLSCSPTPSSPLHSSPIFCPQPSGIILSKENSALYRSKLLVSECFLCRYFVSFTPLPAP